MTGYPASLIASAILLGAALLAIAIVVALNAEYRRSWVPNLRRNSKWLPTAVILVLIAQPGMREFDSLTLGQQLLLQGLGVLILLCVAVPGLLHLRNNHPEVWQEVSKSESTSISSAARWVLIRYVVVMTLGAVGPLGLVALLFKASAG